MLTNDQFSILFKEMYKQAELNGFKDQRLSHQIKKEEYQLKGYSNFNTVAENSSNKFGSISANTDSWIRGCFQQILDYYFLKQIEKNHKQQTIISDQNAKNQVTIQHLQNILSKMYWKEDIKSTIKLPLLKKALLHRKSGQTYLMLSILYKENGKIQDHNVGTCFFVHKKMVMTALHCLFCKDKKDKNKYQRRADQIRCYPIVNGEIILSKVFFGDINNIMKVKIPKNSSPNNKIRFQKNDQLDIAIVPVYNKLQTPLQLIQVQSTDLKYIKYLDIIAYSVQQIKGKGFEHYAVFNQAQLLDYQKSGLIKYISQKFAGGASGGPILIYISGKIKLVGIHIGRQEAYNGQSEMIGNKYGILFTPEIIEQQIEKKLLKEAQNKLHLKQVNHELITPKKYY